MMGHDMQWMILPFKRYFDFQGRSRRLEYWMFALLNAIVLIVLFGIAFASRGDPAAFAGADAADPFAGYRFLTGGVVIAAVIWGLAAFIPSIAVTVRRLHDRDMSGWWYLGFALLGVIPVVGFLASVAFFVLLVLPGTPGPNRFGPSPKNEVTAETFE
ncbi:Inner membrane protein YhaH [Alteriqipengyuania sp. 357]